jgi:tetratricopeptide (TPR) repeat protein
MRAQTRSRFPSGKTGWLTLAVAVAALACGPGKEARLEEIRARQQTAEFAPTIEPLRELLEEAPDDPELNHLYGVALLGTKQPELAIWPLRKAAAHPDRAIEDGMLLSLALLRGGSAADGVQQVLRVQELAPDRVDVLRLLVKARLDAKQHEEVLQDAARLLEREPGDPEALLARVLALLSLDRPDEAQPALAELRVAMEERPGDASWSPRICAATATFSKEKGDPEAAEALWNDCLEQFPGEDMLVSGAIDFFAERPGPPRAIEILRRAHEAKPTHLPFLEALATRLGAAGQGAEAEALLRAATHDGVNDVQAWFALSRYHEQRDETAQARDAMAQGLRLMGDAPAALVAAYADLLIRAGDYDEAEALIPRFEPSPVMLNLLRGRLLLARGKPAEALAALQEGLRLWPDHSVARWLAGTAAEQLGDYDRAIEEYAEAVRNDRGNRDAVLSLLRLLEAQGLYDDAMPILARYRSENPNDPELLVETIRFAYRAGAPKAAQGAARSLAALPGQKGVAAAEVAAMRAAEAGRAAGIEAIRSAGLDLAEPTNGPALELLVAFLVAEGRAKEALEATRPALAAHPELALFHELRGRALRGAGQPDAAREALERALELEPERASALAEFAALTAERGDRQAALALYDRAAGADPGTAGHPWAAIQLVAATDDSAELERRLEAMLARHGTHAAAASLLAQQLATRDPERAARLSNRARRFRGGPDAGDASGPIESERADAARAAPTQGRPAD